MAWLLLLVALGIGTDAADKLSHRNPMPVAWFEAGITLVLVLGAIVMMAVDKDER